MGAGSGWPGALGSVFSWLSRAGSVSWGRVWSQSPLSSTFGLLAQARGVPVQPRRGLSQPHLPGGTWDWQVLFWVLCRGLCELFLPAHPCTAAAPSFVATFPPWAEHRHGGVQCSGGPQQSGGLSVLGGSAFWRVQCSGGFSILGEHSVLGELCILALLLLLPEAQSSSLDLWDPVGLPWAQGVPAPAMPLLGFHAGEGPAMPTAPRFPLKSEQSWSLGQVCTCFNWDPDFSCWKNGCARSQSAVSVHYPLCQCQRCCLLHLCSATSCCSSSPLVPAFGQALELAMLRP